MVPRYKVVETVDLFQFLISTWTSPSSEFTISISILSLPTKEKSSSVTSGPLYAMFIIGPSKSSIAQSSFGGGTLWASTVTSFHTDGKSTVAMAVPS